MNVFDPFLNLQEANSANNPLHGSKRTKHKENNVITETYKIVHDMLVGRKLKNQHKIDKQLLSRSFSEPMEFDMTFIKDYIQTISLAYGKS